MQRINERGMAIIRKYEGFSYEAYVCPGGVWTIGFGHTYNVRPGDTITVAEGEDLLWQDVARAEDVIRRRVMVPLNGNQFSALVSWAFNVGGDRPTTLYTRLNSGEYAAVPDELRRWVRAGGRVLRGLERRRECEVLLFEEPMGFGVTYFPALDGCAGKPCIEDDPDVPVGFWTRLVGWLQRTGHTRGKEET